MLRTLDVICILFVVLQSLQVDTRVRHNEELLGPLRSIEAPQDEFGRAARRGRIDILGLILKKRIAHLRRAGQAELVFLVDSSASVGSDNFYNEIKFIRKVCHFTTFTILVCYGGTKPPGGVTVSLFDDVIIHHSTGCSSKFWIDSEQKS